MKIAIAGTGYVGLSNAILLAQHHEVTAVDVIPEKVDMVNRRESPIADAYIEDYLKHKNLSLTATLDGDSAYREAELIIIRRLRIMMMSPAISTRGRWSPFCPRSSG